jgi:hypothetical protein
VHARILIPFKSFVLFPLILVKNKDNLLKNILCPYPRDIPLSLATRFLPRDVTRPREESIEIAMSGAQAGANIISLALNQRHAALFMHHGTLHMFRADVSVNEVRETFTCTRKQISLT